MKIEIKPSTVKRIEKMGGTLTDVAINKAIDIITGEKEVQKSDDHILTHSRPIKAIINGRDIDNGDLSWSFILLEIMALAGKDEVNLEKLGEIFSHPAVLAGRIKDRQHKPIEGTNYSIRLMNATPTGHSIRHGAMNLGYKVYIEHRFENGEIGTIEV